MKKLVSVAALALSLGAAAAFADEMTGYISDSHCGAKHNKVSEGNSKCVETCVKTGEPVLVVGEKVMKFDGDSAAKAKEFAGQNVKIMGSMEGDMIKIASIEKAQ